MKFFLGTMDLNWFQRAEVPLFYAVQTFGKSLPRATTTWALDSGAYTELAKHGTWRMTPTDYAKRVEAIMDNVGSMEFACIQDWVCSPPAIRATGMSVREHQARTVANYLKLVELAPEVPWIPALQGWTAYEYGDHVKMYQAEGVDLTSLELVGFGSIAQRQDDPMVGQVARYLAGLGIRLHGFGVKKTGMLLYGDALVSADSQAWSFDAYFSFRPGKGARRRTGPALPECKAEFARGEHLSTCRHCLRFALYWRRGVLDALEANHRRSLEPSLFEPDTSLMQTHRAVRGPSTLAANMARSYSSTEGEVPRLFEDG
jgi:hypothetical protein